MTITSTRSGNRIDLTNPCSDDIDFACDVAPALANIVRFNGHVGRYSVAEHCFLASHLVAPKHAMHALLHDAHEAYLGDIPTPAREAIGRDSVQVIEAGLQRAVFNAIDISPNIPAEVHEVDQMLCHLEAAQLFEETPDWVNYGLVDECTGRMNEKGFGITRWSAREASQHFYMRLMALEAIRREQEQSDGQQQYGVA